MPDLLDRLKTALADRYAIEKELGSGGMATVYLAEDLKHHRKVAVKVLRPELAAVVGAERFLREIQIAANLNHPHILTLIDSGEAEGFLYYVMPHVQGEALSDKLRREKQLPIEDALDIARDVGSAVAYAHAQGVIHRDLKPGNILLHEGEAMVADFGLALALRAAGGERLTETGLSLGTPEYMSPEQATAEQEVDARSDIYSLGAVLYEMLVGDPPHVATSTQAIIAKLLTERPTPVRILRDTVSESVEQAVMQALAKLPADRFASAERFVDALTVSIPTGGYRQAGSSMSPKAAPVQRARRRRQVVTTVAIVLAAGSGAVAVSMMTGVDPPRSPRVVVLPLDNRTGDSTLDGLGEIVAEQLVDGLAQVRLWTGWERRADVLDVVPFGDVLQLLARLRTDAGGSRGQLGEEIADRLDADLVVSGSYTGTGQADSVRMRVEVVRVEARRTLPPPAPALAAIADPMAGVAVLQRHVMGAVAWAATGGPWAEALRSPPTYDVYEAYAEGNQAQFSGQWAEAEVGYRRAIALDPDFLPAYVTLGGGVFYNTRRWTSMDSLAEAMGRTIDPLTPVARALRDGFAATVRGNIEQMYRTRESLVDLLPFGPSWFEKGFYGLGANHLQDAVAAYKTVVDSAPDFAGKWFTWRGLVWGYHLLGDLERALDAARGSTGSAPPGQTRVLLMISHAAQGNVAETTRLVEEGRNAGVPGLFLTAALVLRRHDQPETADSLAAQLVEILNRSGSSPLLKARALMFLHRYEEAQPILEDLVRQDDGLADKGRLGVTLAGQGLTEEAGRISSELGALGDPYLFGSHTAWRARIAAVLGEQQEAVDLLREAFLQGLTVPNPENMFWLHNDPALEALRGNEDFRKFMRPRG